QPAALSRLLPADSSADDSSPDVRYLRWAASLSPSPPPADYLRRPSLAAQFSDGFLLLHVLAALSPKDFPSNLRPHLAAPPSPASAPLLVSSFVDACRQLRLDGAEEFVPAQIAAGDFVALMTALNSLQLYEITNYQQTRGVEVMTEDGLLEWCKETASASQLQVPEFSSFSSAALSSGTFFLLLLSVCFPDKVSLRLATPGCTRPQLELNYRYLVHILRQAAIQPKVHWRQLAFDPTSDVYLLLTMQIYVASCSNSN
ncbi:MAG: hypothetical protein Q8P67_18230, partial [archaeon]|nr:hypothetical protein [archaeon]